MLESLSVINFPPLYLIAFGFLFVMSNFLMRFGRRFGLPLLSILLLVGYLLGPSFLGLIEPPSSLWQSFISHTVLSLVGLLIGSKLYSISFDKKALKISLIVIVGSIVLIALPLYFLTHNLFLAILIAVLGSFTAPTHTITIIEEITPKNTKASSFSNLVLKVVMYGEILIISLFSILIFYTDSGPLTESPVAKDVFLAPLKTLFSSLALTGLVVSLISVPTIYMCRLMGRDRFKVPEAFGIVLLLAGMSLMLDLSPLLTAIVMGYLITRFTQGRTGTLGDIENIEWLIFIPFFILAGATLHIQSLLTAGLFGLTFVFARIFARYVCGWVAVKTMLPSKKDGTAQWLGLTLLPQGGVVIGAAWVAGGLFPNEQEIIMLSIIGSTVFFEIIGPILLRAGLLKTRA
ncbi:MAG TPA: hypothetical protein DD412_05880 [Holosporales bacterium]|nr:hypothetical protein [Holosporales bacterium]